MLIHLFQRMSQLSGQHQYNGKHSVDYNSSPSELTSRINPLIVFWTPKGFISPEYLLIFFSDISLSSWLQKTLKFIVLRLLENGFVSQIIESVHFYSCPKAKLSPIFLSLLLQARRSYPFPPNNIFGIFPQQKRGRLSSWKMTKIKLARILVTSFDKFLHFCNLYIFGFYLVVP